jgi:hypothetical protein
MSKNAPVVVIGASVDGEKIPVQFVVKKDHETLLHPAVLAAIGSCSSSVRTLRPKDKMKSVAADACEPAVKIEVGSF